MLEIFYWCSIQINSMKQLTVQLQNEYLVHKGQVLGRGATGEVCLGQELATGQAVAVKVVDLARVDNPVTSYLLEMQCRALATVRSPFVLRGIKSVEVAGACYLITELCNGCTLKHFIRKEGPLGEARTLQIIKGIVQGECALLEKGILHRDLKPANIMFHNSKVKIIDFGYCQIQGLPKPKLEYNVGSPSYMSPEAFHQNKYSEKSEVWAIATTFYECLNGHTFDQGRHMGDVFKDLRRYGIKYTTDVSQRLRNIIALCLHPNPKKRPTIYELQGLLNQDRRIVRVVEASSLPKAIDEQNKRSSNIYNGKKENYFEGSQREKMGSEQGRRDKLMSSPSNFFMRMSLKPTSSSRGRDGGQLTLLDNNLKVNRMLKSDSKRVITTKKNHMTEGRKERIKVMSNFLKNGKKPCEQFITARESYRLTTLHV